MVTRITILSERRCFTLAVIIYSSESSLSWCVKNRLRDDFRVRRLSLTLDVMYIPQGLATLNEGKQASVQLRNDDDSNKSFTFLIQTKIRLLRIKKRPFNLIK